MQWTVTLSPPFHAALIAVLIIALIIEHSKDSKSGPNCGKRAPDEELELQTI
jgi:hypothetical protein